MRFVVYVFLAGGVLGGVDGWAQEADIFAFFETEAEAIRLVTASRLPLSARQSPATVYVVTSEDIAASGARTLWDALRGTPGVDVMATRTFYGEASIRGLNKSLNNRTLVLLDGQRVLNGPFDSTFWEGIPVTLDEIDRIEVVAGPTSALYGANALTGVIQIVTRTPERLDGGRVRYDFGERSTHLGSAVYGLRKGRSRYRASAGWRRTNRFEDGGRASEVGKARAMWSYDVSGKARVSFSGGLARYDTEFALGVSHAFNDGTTGFLRADLDYGKTRARVLWNRERPMMRDLPSTKDPVLELNSFDVSVERRLSPFSGNDLVVGGSFRGNRARSNVYSSERIRQSLWAVFVEDAWRPVEDLTLVASARLDRHPGTGWVFSPRSSLVFSPDVRHVFRVSAGTSFRNPTLTESYISLAQFSRLPGGLQATFELLGDPGLGPERMVQVEAAHVGRFGVFKTTAVGFHYRFRDMIAVDQFVLVPEALPELRARAAYVNTPEVIRAWGGEVSVEGALSGQVTVFSNYSYQRIRGTLEFQVARNGGPAHKVNGGVRVRSGGLRVSLRAHRVGATFWNDSDPLALTTEQARVGGYTLVDASAGYGFSGGLRGLRLGVEAFNLLNHAHAEILPGRDALRPGLSGEVIRRRVMAYFAYGF